MTDKNAPDTNNIILVARKPVKAAAVQFTGRNSTEVATFVRSTGVKSRAGGSYVNVADKRARKGDWVIIDWDESVHVYTNDEFNKLFRVSVERVNNVR